jgi:NAD(P)-dependent dehydrogenase (short-subunit alcohol dehydrogenase family)
VSLAGRVFVVTGANGAIGISVTVALRLHGASVFAFGSERCNVVDTDSVRAALGMVWANCQRLDGVVCCQGAPGLIKPSLDVTDGEMRAVLDIDLVGSFRVACEAMRYMGPQGHGRVVFVSSIHAIATYPKRAAYAAAKAGLCGLTRALAIEWAQRDVFVNAVLPGQVQGTERTKPHENGEAGKRSPSGVFVTPEAVSQAVCYLLDAPGVNGHALVVDDGWLASAWYGDHGADT